MCSLWCVRWLLFRLANVDSLALACLVKLKATLYGPTRPVNPAFSQSGVETGRKAKAGANRVGGARDDGDATTLVFEHPLAMIGVACLR